MSNFQFVRQKSEEIGLTQSVFLEVKQYRFIHFKFISKKNNNNIDTKKNWNYGGNLFE